VEKVFHNCGHTTETSHLLKRHHVLSNSIPNTALKKNRALEKNATMARKERPLYKKIMGHKGYKYNLHLKKRE